VENEETKRRKEEQREKLAELWRKIEACADADGWIRLCEILEDAVDDERVKTSNGASEFIQLILDLSLDAIFAPSADVAIAPLKAALRSDHGKDMAQKRHKQISEIKEWILSEWENRESRFENNKSYFARVYVGRISEKFGQEVKFRTIKDDWLPTTKKKI
jgi:hypothetical protein